MDRRHDCEGRADALELILRGLEGAQPSGAERTPAASEETQDEGSVAAQLLGGVETAVGVWRGNLARCLRPSTRTMPRLYRAASPRGGCMTPSPPRWNVVNSSVRNRRVSCRSGLASVRRQAADRLAGSGWPPACASWSCGALATTESVACGMPRWGTSTDQSRSRATLTKASSAGE